MKIVEVTPNITRLTLFRSINCYLVRENDGLTLVDTTMAQGATAILAQANTLGAPIRRILLTHAHMDHVGGMDAVAQKLSSVEIWMGARETGLYQQAQQGLQPKQFELEAGEPQTPVRGGFPAMKVQVTHQFQDGDRIGSLRAVFTPGHTPGHMAFLDTRDGTLLVGDALVAFGPLRVPGDAASWTGLGIVGNWATWHKLTALESGLRIAMLKPERIACGHGDPVTEGVQQKLASALDHAGQRFRHSTGTTY
jgi:glyoxylase-like metal-dependent hydrolase (beta-lactamase superfamily II)